jgi:hypothetical protein
MATANLTAARLRELLHYDPATGVFTWKVKTSIRVMVGQVAGARHKLGYIVVGIEGAKCYAHRLAWLHATGSWPTGSIDHIDGDVSNNKLENLRDVPQAINMQNYKTARRDSTTGLLGVWAKRDKWAASIRLSGKTVHLGSFATQKEAHQAYLLAKRRLHQGCTI